MHYEDPDGELVAVMKLNVERWTLNARHLGYSLADWGVISTSHEMVRKHMQVKVKKYVHV